MEVLVVQHRLILMTCSSGRNHRRHHHIELSRIQIGLGAATVGTSHLVEVEEQG